MTQLPPNGDEESSVATDELRDVIIAAVPPPAANHAYRWAMVVRRVRRRRRQRLATTVVAFGLVAGAFVTSSVTSIGGRRDLEVQSVNPEHSPTSLLPATSTPSGTSQSAPDRHASDAQSSLPRDVTLPTVSSDSGRPASSGEPGTSAVGVVTTAPPNNTAEPPPSDAVEPSSNTSPSNTGRLPFDTLPPRSLDPAHSVATSTAPVPWIVPPGSSGSSTARVISGADPRRAEPGVFKTFCAYAYMSNVDPLGGSDAAFHAFWGNTETASGIGPRPSATANSTCRGGTLDRSAYWFVAMADASTRTLLAPLQAQVFYSVGYLGVDPALIEQMPLGLRLTVGPAESPYGAAVQWSCGGSIPWTADRPACANTTVYLRAFFPQCWDGRLDSPDHRSHLAYAVGGRCPTSHPRALPEVTYRLVFQAPPTGIDGWQLLTGDSQSALGGLVNGWDAQTEADWMAFCITAQRECVGHLGGGRMLDGEV